MTNSDAQMTSEQELVELCNIFTEASNAQFKKAGVKPILYYQATEAGIKAVLAALQPQDFCLDLIHPKKGHYPIFRLYLQ